MIEDRNELIFYKRNINFSLVKASRCSHYVIRARVTYNGQRIDLKTKIRIDSPTKQWDKKKQRVKQGCMFNGQAYSDINAIINSYESFIHEYFTKCTNERREPILKELRDRFNYKFKQTQNQKCSEFFLLFDEFIKEQSGVKGWGEAMIETFKRLKDRLRKFRPTLTFMDLTIKTMEEFKLDLAESMYNDSILKRLSYLKTFVKWAKQKKYTVNEEFFLYQPKLPKAQKAVRYLEIEELDKIYNLELESGSALDQTRDMFIFQCYTALRYCDIKQLKKHQVYQANDGSYIINLLTEKDNDNIQFKLADRAREIFLKYSQNIYDHNAMFPVLSNQKYNEHLKELGKLAGLKGEWIDYEFRLQEKIEVRIPKEDLASHTARRTFVVTAYNEGVPLDLIMLITSHSDVKAMKPYLKGNLKGSNRVIEALNKASH